MPELPEVESARGLLQRHVAGRTITAVTAADDEARVSLSSRDARRTAAHCATQRGRRSRGFHGKLQSIPLARHAHGMRALRRAAPPLRRFDAPHRRVHASRAAVRNGARCRLVADASHCTARGALPFQIVCVGGLTPAQLSAALLGAKIVAVHRKGKHLWCVPPAVSTKHALPPTCLLL
jgi:formamidopyrimidine-DNA glycosylase